MNNEKILWKVIETYKRLGIKSLTYNLIDLIEELGYNVYTYQELRLKNPELYELCQSFSDEAYKEPLTKTIAYNKGRPRCRIRFSLCHELAHIVLNHECVSKQNEAEANYFASNFLAPRMAIHYSGCKNARDVAKIFYLSEEAAEIAFDDYRRWHRIAVCRMSSVDWEFYHHFYNEDAGKFVYINETCPCCGRKVYNTTTCPVCSNWGTRSPYRYNPFRDPLSSDSRAMLAPFY